MGTAATDISAILGQAASETLENLAFAEIAPRENSRLEGPSHGFHGSRIDLGTLGTLVLVIRREMLEDLASVLFSATPGGIDAEMVRDAHLEILNIIAGRFLEGLFRENSDFVMGLPELHLDLDEWNALPVRLVMAGEDGKELAMGLKPLASPL